MYRCLCLPRLLNVSKHIFRSRIVHDTQQEKNNIKVEIEQIWRLTNARQVPLKSLALPLTAVTIMVVRSLHTAWKSLHHLAGIPQCGCQPCFHALQPFLFNFLLFFTVFSPLLRVRRSLLVDVFQCIPCGILPVWSFSCANCIP